MDELYEFLLSAKKSTYAANTEPLRLADGGKRFQVESNDFVYLDTYYGYQPFGGQELLFKRFPDGQKMPIWYMNYGGACLRTAQRNQVEMIFIHLKNALIRVDESYPFRGPKNYEFGVISYKSEFLGDLENFSGKEQISYKDGDVLYQGFFFGGKLNSKELMNCPL